MPMKPVTVRRWEIVVSFLAVTVAFVAAVVWLTHLSHESGKLARANQDRITDIQQSRLEGCVRVYESFREVFKPLLPPPPMRTLEQRVNIAKFNRILNSLQTRCVKQINPKGTS